MNDDRRVELLASVMWAVNCRQCEALGVMVMIPWRWQEDSLKDAWREMAREGLEALDAAFEPIR